MLPIYQVPSPASMPLTSRLRALVPALCFFLIVCVAPSSAEQTTWLDAEGNPLSAHVIGDSVVGHLSGVAADQAFELVLEDEGHRMIATAEVISNADGRIPATDLWSRTGVVGCDSLHGFGDVLPDPDAYRFAHYVEAEQILGGRTFRLRLLKAGTDVEIAGKELQLTVGKAARFFFSDGTGCPRDTLADDEDVYLTALHLPEQLSSVYVFLVAAQASWMEDDPLADVRTEYQSTPQLIELGEDDTLTELLWPAAATENGRFDGFIRNGNHSPAAQVLNIDWRTHQRPRSCGSKDGLTIPDVPVSTGDGGGGCDGPQ